MPARARPVFFADENALGLGKLLRRIGREDVLYPGHEEMPEVPLSTPDLEWMTVVARRELVVLSRDRRIRTRPAELKLYTELGLRSVWIGAKQHLSCQAQLLLFLKHEARLQHEIRRGNRIAGGRTLRRTFARRAWPIGLRPNQLLGRLQVWMIA
jgi:hypothetical protein